MRRRALVEQRLLRRRLELEHVQRIARRGDDAVRAERSSSAAQHVVALRERLMGAGANRLAMAPAEVAARSGLPARKCRNWRRAIALRFEISGPLRVISVMGASIVSAAAVQIGPVPKRLAAPRAFRRWPLPDIQMMQERFGAEVTPFAAAGARSYRTPATLPSRNKRRRHELISLAKLLRTDLLTAGRKMETIYPFRDIASQFSLGRVPADAFKGGNGMTDRFATAEFTGAIRRWRPPAIVTLAALAALSALIAAPPADAAAKKARARRAPRNPPRRRPRARPERRSWRSCRSRARR